MTVSKFISGVIALTLAASFTDGFTATAKDNVRKGYTKQSPPRTLTKKQEKRAASNYQKYCALCHGADRAGYANDNAPSLKSRSLLESGVAHSILRPLSYGRAGTPMGGYLDEVGGPMNIDEAWDLTYWLFWQEKFDRVRLSENPVKGDIQRGAALFKHECAQCHGEAGTGKQEGDHMMAPILANRDALAHNKDEFYRYAIRHGRENTAMQAYNKKLSATDIDNLTAYIRSFENGDKVSSKTKLRAVPEPKDYIINKDGKDPTFKLKDKRYVSATDLHASLKNGDRMVLLDTRVPSVWQRSHIDGAVPVPYYTDIDKLMKDIPKGVMIVSYCSCPRAASDYLIDKLDKMGYTRTAVMWEGIFGWMKMGYPVTRGDVVD